jgi:hypothetical protein
MSSTLAELIEGRKRTVGYLGSYRAGRLAAALVLAATVPWTPAAAADPDTGGEPIEFAVVAAAGNSGVSEPLRQAVRDPAAWRQVWERIHATVSPTPALPEIDFARETVIVVALGERMSGGYGIAVEEIRLAGDRLLVQVRLDCPPKGLMTTMAVTQPVQAVRLSVPAQARPPEFVDRPAAGCDRPG